MRKWFCLVLLGCIVIAGSTRELFADSLTLLNDTSLMSTVHMAYTPGPILSPAFNEGNYYAGGMKWTDDTTHTSFVTFCIDINHDVNLGVSGYQMTPGGTLNAAFPTKPNVVGALYYLFGEFSPPTLAFANSVTAAEFQLAVWDLIYNFGSGSTPLVFSPYGMDSTQIGAAHTMATTAWNEQTSVSPGPNPETNPNLQAILITGSPAGQAQVYIGPVGDTLPTPLPSSVTSGLVLLGLVGICVKGSRKRKSRFLLN